MVDATSTNRKSTHAGANAGGLETLDGAHVKHNQKSKSNA
jgi:hypothetical protein